MRKVHSAAELTYPEMFKTDWPIDDDFREFEKAYEKGREIAEEFGVIHIAENGGVSVQTTTPDNRVNGYISGLPVIGHHAGAYGMLWGMLEGISPIMYVDSDGAETLVKGSGYLNIV